MSIKFKSKGDFKHIQKFLIKHSKDVFRNMLEDYGRRGVAALASATPVNTGITKDSWYYQIRETDKSTFLSWHNSNATYRGTPIVILLRYGHATNKGGYVEGYDFIAPSIRPIFDEFTRTMWEEVTSS